MGQIKKIDLVCDLIYQASKIPKKSYRALEEKDISEKDDFDFHTSSIIKMLGLKNSVSVAQTIIGGEIKKLLHS